MESERGHTEGRTSPLFSTLLPPQSESSESGSSSMSEACVEAQNRAYRVKLARINPRENPDGKPALTVVRMVGPEPVRVKSNDRLGPFSGKICNLITVPAGRLFASTTTGTSLAELIVTSGVSNVPVGFWFTAIPATETTRTLGDADVGM